MHKANVRIIIGIILLLAALVMAGYTALRAAAELPMYGNPNFRGSLVSGLIGAYLLLYGIADRGALK